MRRLLCAAMAALSISACRHPPPLPDLDSPAPAITPGTDRPATARVADAGNDACDVGGRPAHFRNPAAALMWIYRDHLQEVYCGCSFTPAGAVDASSCGYEDSGESWPRVALEQAVPAWRFGSWRPCWTEQDPVSGEPIDPRQQCAEADSEFKEMDADLYNDFPAVAALARERGANPYGMVRGEPRLYGACDFETEKVMGKYRLVEPPPDVRGDLARTVLYMAWRYGGDKGGDKKIRLTPEQRTTLAEWDRADPVDDWERTRACRIRAIQGWANPFVR